MSASNRSEDLDEPSQYAPRWIREGLAKPRASGVRRPPGAPQLVASDQQPAGHPSRSHDDAAFEGDVAIRRMRMQRSLEPEHLAEPEWSGPPSFSVGMLVRSAAAIGAAMVGALIYVGALPLPFVVAAQPQETAVRDTTATGTDLRLAAPREEPRPAKMADRLGDPRALPSLAPPPPPDATAEEAAAASRPAQPFALASAGPAPWPTAPVATAAAAPLPRQIDREEVDTLIRRGEAFISQGDIAAARLMLRRAAEAGNPRAALLLGTTFDPDVLRKMGVLGFQPDAAQAREWYERAASLGSGEASQRLAGMPRQGLSRSP